MSEPNSQGQDDRTHQLRNRAVPRDVDHQPRRRNRSMPPPQDRQANPNLDENNQNSPNQQVDQEQQGETDVMNQVDERQDLMNRLADMMRTLQTSIEAESEQRQRQPEVRREINDLSQRFESISKTSSSAPRPSQSNSSPFTSFTSNDERLRSKVDTILGIPSLSSENADTDKKIKERLNIKPTQGYENVPELDDELTSFQSWLQKVNTWRVASGLNTLHKIPPHSRSVEVSPYINRKNTIYYQLLLAKVNKYLHATLESEARNDGVEAFNKIVLDFEMRAEDYATSYRNKLNALPAIKDIGDPVQMLEVIMQKIKMQEELNAVLPSQHVNYQASSAEIFYHLETSTIPEVRNWALTQKGLKARCTTDARTAMVALRNHLNLENTKPSKKMKGNQFATETVCNKCKKKGHIAKDCRSHLECTICAYKGHTADKCFHRRKSVEEQKKIREQHLKKMEAMKKVNATTTKIITSSSSSTTSSSIDDEMPEIIFGTNASASNSQAATVTWRIDSGATYHSTGDKNIVFNLNDTDLTLRGFRSDDEGIKALGVGTTYIGEYPIQDVYLFEETDMNLFSTARAKEAGWKVDLMNEKLTTPDGKELNIDSSSGTPHVMINAVTVIGKDNSNLWHDRLNHANNDIIKHTEKQVEGMHVKGDTHPKDCKCCFIGKNKRKKSSRKVKTTSESPPPFSKLQIDYSGPYKTRMLPDNTNMIAVCIDEGSEYAKISRYNGKSGANSIDALEKYLVDIGQKPEIIQTDSGTEFCNREFTNYLQNMGIKHKVTQPGESNQLGKVEAHIRECYRAARAMLDRAQLPDQYGAYAIEYASYIRNRISNSDKPTPYEKRHEKKPNLKNVKVFGSIAYIRNTQPHLDKFHPRAFPVIFIGLDESDGFKFWNPITKKEIRNRNAWFNEQEPGGLLLSNTWWRAKRQCVTQDTNKSYLNERFIVDPQSHNEAMARDDWNEWIKAEESEIENLTNHGTWEIVDSLPGGIKPIKTRWQYKTKFNSDNTISKRKARICAKGFMQKYGVDFFKTYAPTPFLTTFRLVMILAVINGLVISSGDVSGAFLYANVDEEIYIQLPDGKHARLIKSIYGLKQAAYNWREECDNTLIKDAGLIRTNHDKCLYFKHNSSKELEALLMMHTDDFLNANKNQSTKDQIINALKMKYDIKDTTDENQYLGMNIFTSAKKNSIGISAYINRLLKDYEMEKCNPVTTPTTQILNPPTDEQFDPIFAQGVPYRSIVGKLAWIANTCRPDIAFVTNMLARAVCKPSEEHYKVAIKTLRYLSGTKFLGQVYTNNSTSLDLEVYADADLAGRNDRYSTAGFIVLLNKQLLSWKSKTIRNIVVSTTEAEISAVQMAAREVQYLRGLINEIIPNGICTPIKIYNDNLIAVKAFNEEITQARTAHLDIKLKHVREMIMNQVIQVEHIRTTENIADMLTKPLNGKSLAKLRNQILQTM